MMPYQHLRHQGPGLRALVRLAGSAIGRRPDHLPPLPGPATEAIAAPPPADLVRDAVRWAGGDDARAELPAWLWPYWGFPLLGDSLVAIPWPLTRVLNQGCRLDLKGPLPLGAPLHTRAWLQEVTETPGKVRLHQRLVTGPATQPDALTADMFAVIPVGKPSKSETAGRERPAPPADATLLARTTFGAHAGLEFALLTGDFNPVHWVAPWAKLAGFKRTILHGFGLMARLQEALITHAAGGDPRRLSSIDVRFTRPLVLPAEVGLYCWTLPDGELGIGAAEAPGEPAFLIGKACVHEGGKP